MVAQRGGAGIGGQPASQVLRIIALVLGALDVVFLSVFTLDAFTPGIPLADQLVGFSIHLVPSTVLAVLIAIAWWSPVVGGVALILASSAPFVFLSNPIGVNLILSLPVLAVGCLFVWSAWLRSLPHRTS